MYGICLLIIFIVRLLPKYFSKVTAAQLLAHQSRIRSEKSRCRRQGPGSEGVASGGPCREAAGLWLVGSSSRNTRQAHGCSEGCADRQKCCRRWCLQCCGLPGGQTLCQTQGLL